MTRWAKYLKRLTHGSTQAAISAKIGVDQSTVSRWLRGVTVPDHAATVAHCAQSYGGNVLEAFVAADLITPEQAGMTPPGDVDFYTLVDEDGSLSEHAKIHLKNQYGLLRSASAHSRTHELRERIVNDAALDDATRERLLAHFDDAGVTIAYTSSATVIEGEFPRADVSGPSDTPDVALAADLGDDAAGESESYNET